MPELPDVEAYLHALRPRIAGCVLRSTRICSPFVVRSVEPALELIDGRHVTGLRRVGKRIAIGLGPTGPDEEALDTSVHAALLGPAAAAELWLVIHLMIAGRLLWLEGARKPPAKITLATFQFERGLLALTEAGTTKRASIHLVSGAAELAQHDPGGVEPLDASADAFVTALCARNRTLKRALTDPHAVSGIGNAFSDEILHAARLSPLKQTAKLSPEEGRRLWQATREVLTHWRDLLCRRAERRFPGTGEVTAFRPEFAAHGKYKQPCPVCGTPIARIVSGESELNYCPTCQTGGKLLKDRSLSRLLGDDWPDRIEPGQHGADAAPSEDEAE